MQNSPRRVDRTTKIELAAERIDGPDVRIVIPAQMPHPADSVIEVIFEGEPVVSKSRLLDPAAPLNRLHVFDSDHHDGVRFMDGKANRDCTLGWNNPDTAIIWNVRLDTPALFDLQAVGIHGAQGGGTIELKIGEHLFFGTLNGNNADIPLGRIDLAAGTHYIRLRPLTTDGTDAIQLRCVDLITVR